MTDKVRLSYPRLFTPEAMEEGGTAKYSASLIIPKDNLDLLAKIEKAIQHAYQQGKAKFGGTLPKKWDSPLRDGDEDRDEDEAYQNSMFINPKSTRKPEVVDRDLNVILDEEEVYPGCYVRAGVTFYAYNFNGKKGVAVSLDTVQKYEDGDRLGASGASAEDDFADDPMFQ